MWFISAVFFVDYIKGKELFVDCITDEVLFVDYIKDEVLIVVYLVGMILLFIYRAGEVKLTKNFAPIAFALRGGLVFATNFPFVCKFVYDVRFWLSLELHFLLKYVSILV